MSKQNKYSIRNVLNFGKKINPTKNSFSKILFCTGIASSIIYNSSIAFTESDNYKKFIKKPRKQPNLGPVIMDIPGTSLTLDDIPNIMHPVVGGVILMKWNIESEDQVRRIIQQIKHFRPDILIYMDQEGGYIQWLQGLGIEKWPSAHTYGEIYDENPKTAIKIAEKFGKKIGQQLSDLGIDVALAPVLDLHTPNSIIGKKFRAFHSNPEVVTKLASAFANGLREGGVISVGKHFPGHGITLVDSHDDIPRCNASLKKLEQKHLYPFIELSKNKTIDGIMPAHIIYSEIDSKNTVSLSQKWLDTILKKKYKFKGFVISDCLFMEGANIGTMDERIVKALKSGCDLVIVTHQKSLELSDTLNAVKSKTKKDDKIINWLKLKNIYSNLNKIRKNQ